MGPWITGKEILHRWMAAPFELADAIRAGLVPIDTARGTRRTPDTDPCLVCRGGRSVATCTGCQREIIDRIVDGKQQVKVNRHCRLMGEDEHFESGFREYIEQAVFLLSEVEGYEKAHSLKQPNDERPKRSKKQAAQDIKAEREMRIERLFEKANAWAHEEFISQGRRMIHDELYAFLNSISEESVSSKIETIIWKRLPKKARNGPGRRRCAE